MIWWIWLIIAYVGGWIIGGVFLSVLTPINFLGMGCNRLGKWLHRKWTVTSEPTTYLKK